MNFDLEIVYQHFPEATPLQRERLALFARLIAEWNQKINLVSRPDIENLPMRHLLHSLAIAKIMPFKPTTTVVDVGTGGGFPGIPLAIMFPEARFLLIDSIGKKINVVNDCIERLGLENAVAIQCRAEMVDRQVDFVVARGVTQLPKFMEWIRKKIKRSCFNDLQNGVLYLKGGELADELASIPEKATTYPIRDYFDHEEFDRKFVVHIPVKR